MIFQETSLEGAYMIGLEKRGDERGFFARAFCQKEFAAHGLTTQLAQVNFSQNARKGTLRGMHYQLAPRADTKVVRCFRGAIFDVILDLRRDSPTFGRTYSAELTAHNARMMYIPKGFAHGFITLADDTEVLYLVDDFYAPEYERGIRWDDPKFAIPWPAQPGVISEKDRNYRDFDPAWHLQA
jgi:dTDP-4-dehydrorhamnose 3,5-epimerase